MTGSSCSCLGMRILIRALVGRFSAWLEIAISITYSTSLMLVLRSRTSLSTKVTNAKQASNTDAANAA